MAVKKRPKTLSHGRPPVSQPKERMSSQQSRTIIRTHHRLHKQRAAALKNGDVKQADECASAIEKNGGLKIYQAASKQGQSNDRGGDSSRTLVEWLREAKVIQSGHEGQGDDSTPYTCLEVGALSAKNEISRFPGVLHMTRIDLNSQGPGIEKQDLMERPLPKSPADTFDIISLSLVLNYVPDAIQRGEMLKRITKFLRVSDSRQAAKNKTLPALFLVLPLPCVQNSRYLNEELLLQIMTSLGFTLTNKKNTQKLCYYLFSMTGRRRSVKIEKTKVRDGPKMNNFCVVLS